ncbi:MAG: erythromycin esterase family protein [Planctomycetes bacterium]|nr:erythromycin esterase family protein [Planctomycetota bacterium]
MIVRAPHMELVQAIRPLADAPADYDGLMELVGDSPFVLLGESTHGTHEFYAERARITRRLMEEKGFAAVAVEADWPDAWRVNRFVQGRGDDADAEESLEGFLRFPAWMWRNAEVLDFVGWLRQHNDARPASQRAGFYGLDLYSLFASTEAVIAFLAKLDPEAAKRARERYACFDGFRRDGEQYGFAATLGGRPSCEKQVVAQIVELRRSAAEYASRDGQAAEDETFAAERNAAVARGAEAYYRAMIGDHEASWNVRDRHMAETLESLAAHLRRTGRAPKVVVWEHNSHVGDARATELGLAGEVNVGQLVRERHGNRAVLVGFTTYRGTVTAASAWDTPPERKTVRDAVHGSVENLFHDLESPAFFLPLRGRRYVPLDCSRLERAIGVIYRPDTERQSHYFEATLPCQFDAVIHIDETRAVEPLERRAAAGPEPPETWPTAL